MEQILPLLPLCVQVPRVFVNGTCIGGGSDTKRLHQEGKLLPLIEQCAPCCAASGEGSGGGDLSSAKWLTVFLVLVNHIFIQHCLQLLFQVISCLSTVWLFIYQSFTVLMRNVLYVDVLLKLWHSKKKKTSEYVDGRLLCEHSNLFFYRRCQMDTHICRQVQCYNIIIKMLADIWARQSCTDMNIFSIFILCQTIFCVWIYAASSVNICLWFIKVQKSDLKHRCS